MAHPPAPLFSALTPPPAGLAPASISLTPPPAGRAPASIARCLCGTRSGPAPQASRALQGGVFAQNVSRRTRLPRDLHPLCSTEPAPRAAPLEQTASFWRLAAAAF